MLQGPDGVAADANRRAEELLGLTLEEMQDIRDRAPRWRAYRRDGSVIRFSEQASIVALETGEAQRGFEMGVDVAGGGRRWLQADAVPFLGDDGAVAGVVTSFVDVTDRVAGDERLRMALDATGMGTWDWDLGSGAMVWRDASVRTFGDFVEHVHPDDREFVVATLTSLLDRGESFDLDFRVHAPDGTTRWLAGTGRVVRDAEGHPQRMIGITQDVTSRKEAELERESSQRRLAFLAQATSVLAQSLDYETTLSRLAHLAVPFLADWCGVDIVGEDGELRRVAVAHADPDQSHVARRISTPPDRRERTGVARVVRTGSPIVMPELPREALEQRAKEDERFELFVELGIHSYVVMPLSARGRTLGAIWFAMAETPHRYGPVEVDLAQELARRAALAVDNARLYRERSHVARTLQRTLLPPHLPTIEGLELAARYRAAGDANDIGGDFYDVYETGDGSWHVVIGDVCGKGPEAAAITGLARHTLRAAAMQERLPSRILWMLNEAILRSESDEQFCTAVYCRVATPRTAGGSAVVTLSSGGHPSPYVLRADGSVEPAGRLGFLLGSWPEPDLVDDDVRLDPGDALVLCTDGVAEAAGPRGFFGSERLRDLIATCRGLDAEGIAARIEQAVIDFQRGDPRDDIAVLVMRVPPAPETV